MQILQWLFASFIVLGAAEMRSQDAEAMAEPKRFALYSEFLGSALCLTSIHAEAVLGRFERGSLLETFRVSAGIGIAPIQNNYAPIMGRLIFLQGSGHLELGLGLGVLVVQRPPQENTKQYLPAMSGSDVNITGVVGYRYESPSGGFMFRVAATPTIDMGTKEFIPFGGFSIGWAW
ncbi:MAG: hypothetical protein NTX15_00225 [Candidatus Kapabacteria bacterium]|nr:hypothetical protein [Candidatus Kapabacteria bacterium]